MLRLIAFDVRAAFGLLSRLPVAVDLDFAAARGSRGVWAYPIVGAAVGGVSGAAYWAVAAAGAPLGVAAAAALGVAAFATGALHEDGLSDAADGLAARDPETARAIMKDSRLGTYGGLALTLSVLARWSALAALTAPHAVAALIAAGAVSRGATAAAMGVAGPAPGDGLGARVGRAPPIAAITAVLLSVGVAALLGLSVVVPVALIGAAVALAALVRRLGGWTGDVLGAVQQVAEICALAAAAAWLGA